MPASMMRPDTGSRWKVSGSSIAIVAIGPMPGSTPINVPINAPIRANIRFAGVSATSKPTARLFSSSILPLRPDRDRQSKADDEDAPRQRDQNDRRHQRLEWP